MPARASRRAGISVFTCFHLRNAMPLLSQPVTNQNSSVLSQSMQMPRRRFLQANAATVACAAMNTSYSASSSILIGQSLPLTGALASYGQAKLLGSKSYFSYVNSKRSEPSINVLALDDQYDADKTVANTHQLVKEHRVSAYLGYFGVPTINAALPVFEALKIPIVGLTSGSHLIRASHRAHVFPVRASYLTEIEKIVAHMRIVGIRKVGLFIQANAFGQEIQTSFTETARASGIEELNALLLPSDMTQAVPLIVQASKNVDAIFLATLSGQAVAAIQTLRSQQAHQPIYGLSALDASFMRQKLGTMSAGIIQSQVILSPVDPTKRICQEYATALKKFSPQEVPSYFGLEGFIEAKILHEGIKKANYSSNPTLLRNALEQLGQIELGGIDVSYGVSRHAGLRYVDLTILGAKGSTVR
jgi:branched-chain amino acid transport system substrate-binding protein